MKKKPKFIYFVYSLYFKSNSTNTWKISSKSFKIIFNIISGFRLSPLLWFISFKVFAILFFVLQFIFLLNLLIQIIFIESFSKTYRILLSIIHALIDSLTIFFYIPLTELYLIPLKWNDSYLLINSNEFKYLSNFHYLLIILGITSAISFL